MTQQYPPRSRQRGAVLLTVLVLVATMAALAVSMMDDIRFSIRRTANIAQREQAFWYAFGAEELARQAIWRSWQIDSGRSTLDEPWAQEGARFAIDGGYIEGDIADGGNCFNLNSLVERRGRNYVPREEAGEQFRALMAALEIGRDAAETIAHAVTDWIDSDDRAMPRGAEDYRYGTANPPYRTSATLIIEAEELRGIRKVTPQIYARLRPFICALPEPALSVINVNTLRLEQAPLLVMLVGEGALSLLGARAIIAARPERGYRDIATFLETPPFSALADDSPVRSQLAVQTRYYALRARIYYEQAYVTVSSLFELVDSGRVILRGRRLGEAS